MTRGCYSDPAMSNTTFRAQSWAPRVIGVISIALALPGTAMLACSGLGDQFTARYAGLEVVQNSQEQGSGVQLRVAGRQGGKRPSPKAMEGFLLLAKVIVWGFALVSLLLLPVGIGQALYRGWGRRLSMAWGALAGVVALVTFVLLLPEYSTRAIALCDQVIGGRTALQVCPSMSVGELMLYLAMALVYPLINMIYFSSESAHKAMTRG